MAIWKDQSSAKKDTGAIPSFAPPEAAKFDAPPVADIHPSAPKSVSAAAPVRAVERESKESLIASDITIEGKIEGSGSVRIAGRFKGDVNVKGNLTIEPGAKLTGGVRATKVTIAGELEGNIEAAQRVELLEAGVLIGDVKAGTLTVAAGSRMRGQMEFGWEEKPTRSSGNKTENGAES